MSEIVIVDTTVFLNLLNVPYHNDDKKDIDKQFRIFLNAGARIVLPLAVVLQAGDHIADLARGDQRRRWSIVLRDQARKALTNRSPWSLAPLPDSESVEEWLAAFPEFSRTGTGYGMSLLSIVRIWKRMCSQAPHRRVFIWSLNRRLREYDRPAP